MNSNQPADQPRTNTTKTWLLIGLIALLAIAVPVGLYFISTIPFSTGTSGTSLSAPDTGISAEPQPAAAPQPAANRKTMDLLVLDSDSKQPLAGLQITGNFRGGTAYTDAGGHAHLTASPNERGNFYVRVSGHNYLTKRLDWMLRQADGGSDEIPATYTLLMEHGTTIGGKVIDDAGQPVAGATVTVFFNKRYPSRHEIIDPASRAGRTIRTADNGTWEEPNVPKGCDQIFVGAWDNQYVMPDRIFQPFPNLSRLYDRTATLVLRRGVNVTGTVTGPDGNPVDNATVTLGANPDQGFGNYPPLKTDASGKFVLHLDPGQHVMLTVQSDQFAPEMKTITAGNGQPIAIALSKPHRIFGQLLDPNWKPVADAQLSVSQWRGARTLKVNFRSDAKGNFQWDRAPADAVTFEVEAPNLRNATVELTPDTENTVHLIALGRIHGTVTDARTGSAISNFRMALGIQFNPEEPQLNWQPGFPGEVDQSPGSFRFRNNWPYAGIAVRVQAKGYMSADSRIIRPNEANAELNLRLQPAKDITVTVRDPAGAPVSDALGLLVTPDENVFIENSRDVANTGGSQATSSADGNLDFAPQLGDYRIVVFGENGYAEAARGEIQQSPALTLEPYARVTGQMRLGSSPAADTEVILQPSRIAGNRRNAMVQDELRAQTDGQGKFTIERVPPGNWAVCRRVQIGDNDWTYAPVMSIELKPGQTAQVTVGGNGRPVVGRVILPESLVNRADWTWGYSQLISQNDLPVVRIPFRIAGDGTFRIDDVPAGHYVINFNIRSNTPGASTDPLLAAASAKVLVSPIAGGHSDEPLRIDPIQMIDREKYEVGDTIVDLPMRSSAGKDVKFSDFHGKYLLLDFEGPKGLAWGQLEKVFNEYSGDPRLAILTFPYGVNGRNITPPRNPEVPWEQMSFFDISPTVSMVLDRKFSLSDIRGAWLLDPTGKILAMNLSGDAIEMAVIAALGPPATQPSIKPSVH